MSNQNHIAGVHSMDTPNHTQLHQQDRLKWIRKLEVSIYQICKWTAFLLMTALLLLVSLQVLSRYFLSSPTTWTSEVSRFCFIWIAFLGTIIVFREREHLNIDILLVMFPNKVKSGVDVLVSLMNFCLFVGITIAGVQLIIDGALDQTSPVLSINYGVVYAIIPFTGVDSCLFPNLPAFQNRCNNG